MDNDGPTPEWIKLFLFFLIFRWINSFLVQTQFDPDEFWQGLEPAHFLVFGDGFLTWEWAQNVEIRSWVHPLLLSMPMRILKFHRLDNSFSVTYFTRAVIHGTLLAFSDLSTCKLVLRVFKKINYLEYIVLLVTTNWFLFYCGVRMYSNTIEGCLLTVSLAFWPLNSYDASFMSVSFSLILAAISIVVRPTAIVSWIYLGTCYALFDISIFEPKFWKILCFQIMPIAVTTIVASICIDSFYYDHFVVVLWNFFDFNVFRGLSSLYGTHPWYWYFLECMPAILGIQLPLFLYGCLDVRVRRLVGLCLFSLLVLSANPHKELRFAFPILPTSLVIASNGLHKILRQNRYRKKFIYPLIIALGVIPAVYLSLIHQRAPIEAAATLSKLRAEIAFVDVLLPCHSMPFIGMIHNKNIATIRFLDCSPHILELKDNPRLNSSFQFAGKNESYLFKTETSSFVKKRYQKLAQLPDLIVTSPLFQPKLMLPRSYRLCGRFPHAQDDLDEIIFLCANY